MKMKKIVISVFMKIQKKFNKKIQSVVIMI